MKSFSNSIVLAGLCFLSPGALAGNFAECILDNMPGASNGATSAAIFQSCGHEYQDRYSGVVRGSGKGLFGYKDGNACIVKLAKETVFQPAASAIAVACRCLYDDPQFRGQTCADFFQQLNNR